MSRGICIFFGMLVMLAETYLVGSRSVPSDIWIRKMKTYFRILDFDGDGVISRADFHNMAERAAKLEQYDPVQRESAQQRIDDLFSAYTAAAGTKDDVLLTVDLLMESVELARNDPSFKNILNDFLFIVFDPVKVQKKGYFNYGEYRRMFADIGIVDTQFTKAAFAAVDTDHDEKVSLAEFMYAHTDYICSDDENSTAMFGLLF